jgi:hypothetical protein
MYMNKDKRETVDGELLSPFSLAAERLAASQSGRRQHLKESFAQICLA